MLFTLVLEKLTAKDNKAHLKARLINFYIYDSISTSIYFMKVTRVRRDLLGAILKLSCHKQGALDSQRDEP
jgi:hypothetical protein